MEFGPPVAHVYNPLDYAWDVCRDYVTRYAHSPCRIMFLGMNPGPFGMVQTGVPFGDVACVRGWLGLQGRVRLPARQHPRRPVQGFDCPRCEVSGQRLWGLFASRFDRPERFFREHFVLNYCPLAFVEESGRNRTPDKLPARTRQRLFGACDVFLKESVDILQPEWVIGIGDFAHGRAVEVLGSGPRLGRILHPSPASPTANRDWAGLATKQLVGLGVWPS